jgi:hypothetical protein
MVQGVQGKLSVSYWTLELRASFAGPVSCHIPVLVSLELRSISTRFLSLVLSSVATAKAGN